MFDVQRTDEVVKTVQDILTGRFENDPIAFGPIVVEPAIDHDDDDYMRITIVFEGDPDLLDPSWSLGLTQLIGLELSQKDIGGFDYISKRYVEKSEWEAIQANRY